MVKGKWSLLQFLKNVVVLLMFIFVCEFSNAQDNNKVLFEGYIFSEDSLPVENAYVINYSNQKIVTTDSLGYFKTPFNEGDSLMINHISLNPLVVHANRNISIDNRYYIDYKIYTLESCLLRKEAEGVNIANFERNIQVIYKSIEKLGYKRNIIKPMDSNKLPIDLGKLGSGNASVNLLTIRDMIMQARRNRYLKVKTKK